MFDADKFHLPEWKGLSYETVKKINHTVYPTVGALFGGAVGLLHGGWTGMDLGMKYGVGLGEATAYWADGEGFDWRRGGRTTMSLLGLQNESSAASSNGEILDEATKANMKSTLLFMAGYAFGRFTPEPIGRLNTVKTWVLAPAWVFSAGRLADGALTWFSTGSSAKGKQRLIDWKAGTSDLLWGAGYYGSRYGTQMTRAIRRGKDEIVWAYQQTQIAKAGKEALLKAEQMEATVLKMVGIVKNLERRALATESKVLVLEQEKAALRAELDGLKSARSMHSEDPRIFSEVPSNDVAHGAAETGTRLRVQTLPYGTSLPHKLE